MMGKNLISCTLEQNTRDEDPRDAQPDWDIVDETSLESFPASDPPSWTPLKSVGPPATTKSPDKNSSIVPSSNE
jgi:hypothetical protein